MNKTKTIVIAGAAGLIGSYLFDKLSFGCNVIGFDTKESNCKNIMKRDLTDSFLVDRLFTQNRIFAYINCAYPKTFEEHCSFFMKTTEVFCYYFKRYNVSGNIINMASIYGLLGPDTRIYEGTNVEECPNWYAAAKGAIIAHSRCLATKYAKDNIRINCIAPGGVYDGQDSLFIEKYNNRIPLRKMIGKEDIYKAVKFLLESESVTGQVLPIDGGLTAW